MSVADDLEAAIGHCVGIVARGTPPQWPLDVVAAEGTLYERYPHRLLDAMDRGCPGGRWTREQARRSFGYPARVAELFYLLIGLPLAGLGPGDRERLGRHLGAILRAFRPEDPVCRRGTGRLWDPQEVDDRLAEATPITMREHQRLSASLLSMAECVGIGVPQIVSEVHGPYPWFGGVAVVRTFHDLVGMGAVVEAWEPLPTAAHGSIHLVRVFPEGVDVTYDFTNHAVVEGRGTPTHQIAADAGVATVDALTGSVATWVGAAAAVLRAAPHEALLEWHSASRHRILTGLAGDGEPVRCDHAAREDGVEVLARLTASPETYIQELLRQLMGKATDGR